MNILENSHMKNGKKIMDICKIEFYRIVFFNSFIVNNKVNAEKRNNKE